MLEILPDVLIVSNKFDFSTDYICVELKKQGISYFRINRDELKDYIIELNPLIPELTGTYKEVRFKITEKTLKSIYYRAPTFLRDIFQHNLSEEEQLIRSQWSAFVRALCIFENIRWMNNPTDIYAAEIKPFQLYKAAQIGFNVPPSLISNRLRDIGFNNIAIKSIDTAIINDGDNEGFVYTEIYKSDEITEEVFSSPFFIQEGLIPKIDIRVTVINEKIIAVKIFKNSEINIDWRREKDILQYEIINLPESIECLCVEYLQKLNLTFGGIDLVFHNDKYYFIEINPTGEWGWLQQNTGYRFDYDIVNALK